MKDFWSCTYNGRACVVYASREETARFDAKLFFHGSPIGHFPPEDVAKISVRRMADDEPVPRTYRDLGGPKVLWKTAREWKNIIDALYHERQEYPGGAA